MSESEDFANLRVQKIVVDTETFEALESILDMPLSEEQDTALRDLLARKPVWED